MALVATSKFSGKGLAALTSRVFQSPDTGAAAAAAAAAVAILAGALMLLVMLDEEEFMEDDMLFSLPGIEELPPIMSEEGSPIMEDESFIMDELPGTIEDDEESLSHQHAENIEAASTQQMAETAIFFDNIQFPFRYFARADEMTAKAILNCRLGSSQQQVRPAVRFRSAKFVGQGRWKHSPPRRLAVLLRRRTRPRCR